MYLLIKPEFYILKIILKQAIVYRLIDSIRWCQKELELEKKRYLVDKIKKNFKYYAIIHTNETQINR